MTQANWTEKHLRYSIAQRLTPTAIKLYQWLLGEMQEGCSEIIDLHDFQKMVARERGKAHDFRVIQAAIARLADAGILRTIRKFNNFVWKWTIRPINRLIYPLVPKPKKPELRSQIPNLQPSKPTNFDTGKITTTTISILHEMNEGDMSHLEQSVAMCKEAGIRFEPEVAIQVLGGLDAEYVRDAIAYTKARAKSNLEGYLRKCLEQGWHEKRNEPITLTEVFGLISRVARGCKS